MTSETDLLIIIIIIVVGALRREMSICFSPRDNVDQHKCVAAPVSIVFIVDGYSTFPITLHIAINNNER